MSCSTTGKLIISLSADISTANIHDSKMYCMLVEPLAGLVKNILCDLAYDDGSLYHFSSKNHLRLITPVKQYLYTTPRENQTRRVYDSKKGQKLYRDRKISIKPPLFEIIKDTFGVRAATVPVRIVQCKIICFDLCVGVSACSVLQLYYWNR